MTDPDWRPSMDPGPGPGSGAHASDSRTWWGRASRALHSWWPSVLAVVLGGVLAVQRWGWIDLAPALESLVRIVFVTAVAGAILSDFLRFLVWWFWTRRQP